MDMLDSVLLVWLTVVRTGICGIWGWAVIADRAFGRVLHDEDGVFSKGTQDGVRRHLSELGSVGFGGGL